MINSKEFVEKIFKNAINGLKKESFSPVYKEEGIVKDIGDGIIEIEHLKDVGFYELLYLPKADIYALALKIDKGLIKAVVLGDYTKIEVKDEVIGATLNKSGSFEMRATKVGAETMLSQIVEMVKQAQGSRAPIQKLTDMISSYFVPTVIILSIITFLIWFNHWE